MDEPSLFKQLRKGVRDTVLQVPEIERKVKQATSNDKWGPHTKDMQELSRATFSYSDFPLIMNAIWKRFDEPGKHWRHVYKALLLLEYLIKNGSEQVVREAKVHLLQIKTLKEFQYIDEDRKDVGLSVRERAKKLVELLSDDAMINSEREKASKNAGKYTGVSSDDFGAGGGGGGFGGGGSGSGGGGGGGRDLDEEDEDRPKKKYPDPDDDEEEAVEEKPKPKSVATAAAAAKPTKSDSSRPRAPSGGSQATTPAPAAPVATTPSAASLFASFEATPAPATNGFNAFGGDPFASAPAQQRPATVDFFSSAAPQQQKPASAGGFASDPFGSAPFGQPSNNAFASQPTNNNNNSNMFFGAQPQQQPAFGQQSFGSFAQPQPAFQPFQMQPTPASSTPAATTTAAAAAPNDTEKGLLADKTLASAKHLWDLDSLGKPADTATADQKKRAVPMGAISTTGPARKGSAAPPVTANNAFRF